MAEGDNHAVFTGGNNEAKANEVSAQGKNERQTLTVAGSTGGTFTITWSGQTTAAINYDATAATVAEKLAALSNLSAAVLSVTGGPLSTAPVKVEFIGSKAHSDVAAMTTTATNLTNVTGEIQSIAVDAAGGTFTITFSAQTTSAINYNATAAAVTTALEALSNIAPGDVVVTGGPGVAGGATPYVLTFGGTFEGDVAAVTTTATSLTGGASTAAVTTTTAGVDPTATIATPDAGAAVTGLGLAQPVAKPRLPEDTDRVDKYNAADGKDKLPEGEARRDAYPFVSAIS